MNGRSAVTSDPETLTCVPRGLLTEPEPELSAAAATP